MQLKLIKLQSSLFLLVQNCVFVLTCKQLCLCSFSWIVPMRLQWLLPNWFGPASTTASVVCVSRHFSAVCVSKAFYVPLWVQKLQQQAFRCKTIICLHRCQCISTYISDCPRIFWWKFAAVLNMESRTNWGRRQISWGKSSDPKISAFKSSQWGEQG